MIRLTLLIILLCNTAEAQVKFSFPLNGTQGEDYWITDYPDHQQHTNGIKDYNCGRKTYDGHRGTDILVRNFRVMDSGVAVLAVADGVVKEAMDGMYDRNTGKNKEGYGNYLAIHHDEYLVIYAHLKKSTVQLRVGDIVKQGQSLGQVGSSGSSTRPHLHFEVWDKTKTVIIDPFIGGCSSWIWPVWNSQVQYDTTLQILDMMMLPYVPETDSLINLAKEHYLSTDTFYADKNNIACFHAAILGLHVGDIVKAEWYCRQKQVFSYSFDWKFDHYYDHIWPYLSDIKLKGEYRVKLYVNDKILAEKDFYVK